MRRLINLMIGFLSLMLLPVSAFSQEISENAVNSEMVVVNETDTSDAVGEMEVVRRTRTAKDNFGGWFFGAEIIGGALLDPYDSEYLSDYDDGVDTFKWPGLTEILLNTGYLWGEHVFVGPTLNVMGGFAIWLSVDLRVRLVVPFTNADAFALNVGYGFTPFNYSEPRNTYKRVVHEIDIPDDSDSNDIIEMMYLPISLGYEHVFKSGFVIGASVEMRMSFSVHSLRYIQPLYDENNTFHGMFYNGIKREKVVPYVSAMMGGLHLGYKF